MHKGAHTSEVFGTLVSRKATADEKRGRAISPEIHPRHYPAICPGNLKIAHACQRLFFAAQSLASSWTKNFSNIVGARLFVNTEMNGLC
jgi:hypothetical protein